MKARTLMGLFKDQSGSTTITVILSLVLALALMASCLQWYWVNSSSSDIQVVADLGALAAGEVVAQTAMVMQALDGFLLTLNLFGLLLHCIVIVSGVAVVVAAPAGGAPLMTFFEKAIKFNKDFCDKRKEIVADVKNFADTLAAVTPALSIVRGVYAVEQNQSLMGEFNQSDYHAIIIPAPLTGAVYMSDDPEGLEEWEQDLRDAGAENAEGSKRIKNLEGDIEAAIDECFRIDIYKKEGTARAFWHPSFALNDFRSEWESIMMRSIESPRDPIPIDDNESTRAKASERYRAYYERLKDQLEPEILSAIGPDPIGDAPMAPSRVSLQLLMHDEWSQTVLILDHIEGERKAYHVRSDCFGLSNADNVLREVLLVTLRGKDDHPPCTWCDPPSWKSIQMFEDDVKPFIEQWNLAADAILEYEQLRQQVTEEIELVRERTSTKLSEILEMAGTYLMGSRLTYEPSGGRGLWCVVINASSRELPAYTLPSLTGAEGVVLGEQIAIAGVRLMPSATESTLPSFLRDIDAKDASSEGLGGVARSLMGDDATLIPGALALWGTCLDVYGRQISSVSEWSTGLPWGLDVMVQDAMDSILDAAQISVPDMRRPVPTLVSVADVGSVDIEGFEGALSQGLKSGRQLMEDTGGMSTYGIKEHVRTALEELSSEVMLRIEDMLSFSIGGISMRLPFAEQFEDMTGGFLESLIEKSLNAIYQLPDASW